MAKIFTNDCVDTRTCVGSQGLSQRYVENIGLVVVDVDGKTLVGNLETIVKSVRVRCQTIRCHRWYCSGK